MKKFLTFTILIAISVFWSSGQSIQSQDDNSKKFRVVVNVNCDDKITKAETESYIKRELRSLQDITVVKDNIDEEGILSSHNIHIMVNERRFKNGNSVKFETVIVGVFTETIFPIMLLVPHISKETTQLLRRDLLDKDDVFTDIYEDYQSVFILSFKSSDNLGLSNTCKKIVAMFDTEVLEEARQKR